MTQFPKCRKVQTAHLYYYYSNNLNVQNTKEFLLKKHYLHRERAKKTRSKVEEVKKDARAEPSSSPRGALTADSVIPPAHNPGLSAPH